MSSCAGRGRAVWSDASPEPYADSVRFGQQMQILRERRGMSREVLAGLVGMPVDWVKQVENGRIQAPGIDTVLRAAEALRVRDLAELTGRGEMPAPLLQGPSRIT
ncbi:helix-turn-helix transcriptional regulator [Streptomyces sp. NPDC026092]|uniref:helix-turn-helix domain-containing protein n=1 Tax=Streptomyces sp. NPDC026092 TaxID=3154797 RepID=UPI0033FB2CC6